MVLKNYIIEEYAIKLTSNKLGFIDFGEIEII